MKVQRGVTHTHIHTLTDIHSHIHAHTDKHSTHTNTQSNIFFPFDTMFSLVLTVSQPRLDSSQGLSNHMVGVSVGYIQIGRASCRERV